MKILFVTTGTLSKNGSIQRAVHLVKGAAPLGVDGCILLVETDENRLLAKRAGIESRIVWVKGRGLRHYLAYLHQLGRYDSVHLIGPTLAGATIALVSRILGKPVVSDWDELYLSQADDLSGKFRRILLHYLNSIFTSSYIFASSALKQWYIKVSGKKKNTYIPYGLWSPSGIGSKCSGESGAGWALYLGSFNRVYRDDLSEVVRLSQVLAGGPIGLMLVGQGAELGALIEAVSKYLPRQRICVTGFVDDVDELLARENIKLCFLPLRDTIQNRCRCPNKMFHYALAGKIVLTNPVGEVASILRAEAEYYEYGSTDSLRAALNRGTNRQVKYDYSKMDWATRAKEYCEFMHTIVDCR